VTVVVAAATTAVTARVGWSPWWTIPVAVVVALVITQVLAHGMTAPLREMTSVARSMAAGEYGRRVRATSNDEVGDLGRAFNSMAAELEQVDRQRRELIANVSHELRTPISALQAVLENLVDGVQPADPATLATALAQTERLGRLVSDLLDLSRVEAGEVVLTPEPLDVRALLDEAVAEASVAHPHLTYAVAVDPTDLRLAGDRQRLHQLVANLLDNAGRHSPTGGRVDVTAVAAADEVAGATVVLDVVDDGPGIPTDQRELVFERFRQGRPVAGQSPDGGTGLGLAIARWVVALHGGRVVVADSTRGCDVRVVLPVHLPTNPPNASRQQPAGVCAAASPDSSPEKERS
jgi:signal transduction histidine kinase